MEKTEAEKRKAKNKPSLAGYAEAIKNSKAGVSALDALELEEQDDVYDMVDDEQYAKIVESRRAGNDFVVDDGACVRVLIGILHSCRPVVGAMPRCPRCPPFLAQPLRPTCTLPGLSLTPLTSFAPPTNPPPPHPLPQTPLTTTHHHSPSLTQTESATTMTGKSA